MLCLLAVMISTGRPYTSVLSYTNDLRVSYSARTVSSVTSSALGVTTQTIQQHNQGYSATTQVVAWQLCLEQQHAVALGS